MLATAGQCEGAFLLLWHDADVGTCHRAAPAHDAGHRGGRVTGAQAPDWVVTAQQAATLDLILDGAYAPLRGFPTPADVASIRARARLANGTPWRGEPVLTVPATTAHAACEAGSLLLRDEDGTTRAELVVEAAMPDGDGGMLLGGPLHGRNKPVPVAFADLHAPVSELRGRLSGSPITVAQPTWVPGRATIATWERRLEATGGHLVVQPVLPDAPAERWAALVRAHVRAVGHVAAGAALVHVAPLPRDGDVQNAATLRAVVASNLGARTLLDAVGVDAHVAAARGLAVVPPSADGPEPLHRDVQAELDRPTRASDQQGVVVFLTGLSGAGKSTIARALRARLLETGERTVTLLDGDLVRRTLSRGLGFSREDREVNVRRIGWVAAEVARHGGVAICAPIAPEDRVRRAVAADVAGVGGRFVLVHVDTPLAVCETRDPKGLYARARAGDLAGLTGVDAPYERPDDAEVVLDTSVVAVPDAVDLLAHRLCAY